MKRLWVSSIFVCAAAAWGQAPAGRLSFDVASIKPSPPLDPAKIQSGQAHIGQKIDNARVDYGFTPLIGLMMAAFKLQLSQISGPPFIMTDRWDIVAKMPDGATKEQVPQLLQSLLEDRFGMKYHMENKEQSAFILNLAKTGSKLVSANADSLNEEDRDKPAAKGEQIVNAGDSQVRVKQDGSGGTAVTVKGGENGTIKQSISPDGMIHVEIQSMTLEQFCQQLSALLTKPVVDHTGLTGRYSMAIDFSMADVKALAQSMGVNMDQGGRGGPGGGAANQPEASDPGGSSIFKSVEKLGLKLDAAKTPVKTMVIDHIEKTPSEN